MNDRFKFRAALRTETHSIVVDCDCVSYPQYYIDLDDCRTIFENKYENDCFWEFLEEIKKQEHIQEISDDASLIITNCSKNLMQCIGLKDKNGKLIYEGDIINWILPRNDKDVEENYIIVWNEKYVNFTCKKRNGDIMPQIFSQPDLRAKVIGNIYENPELLET